MKRKVDVLNRVKISLQFQNYKHRKMQSKVDVLNRVKISLQFHNYKGWAKQSKRDLLNRVKLSLQFQNYKEGEKQRKVSGWEICTNHQQCRVQYSSMVPFSFGPSLLNTKLFLVCDPWNNGLVFRASCCGSMVPVVRVCFVLMVFCNKSCYIGFLESHRHFCCIPD
jgi:hypothetical protein